MTASMRVIVPAKIAHDIDAVLRGPAWHAYRIGHEWRSWTHLEWDDCDGRRRSQHTGWNVSLRMTGDTAGTIRVSAPGGVTRTDQWTADVAGWLLAIGAPDVEVPR